MSNRLMLFAKLVLCIITFSASAYAHAVLPHLRPNPQTNTVISLGDYLTGHTAFEAMQRVCQNPSLSEVHKVRANSNNLVFQRGGSVHAFQVDK